MREGLPEPRPGLRLSVVSQGSPTDERERKGFYSEQSRGDDWKPSGREKELQGSVKDLPGEVSLPTLP